MTSKNVGGASKLLWFNNLVSDPFLKEARESLIAKISETEEQTGGCIIVKGFKDTTRPVMDKKFLAVFKQRCLDAPERYSPYVISMLKERILIPDREPPRYPAELRQVKNKRSSSALADNEKDATWVCSHLCHNKLCINPAHLRWEPSWFNRLRDNCPGGDNCMHRPDACLNPHRVLEVIDWTQYL